MGSQTGRLALTHYDGGDSPKWVGDDIPSYNSDMLKIDEWAAKIDPVAGVNDTRPSPTIIGAEDTADRGSSNTFARADHRHGILMGTDNDVKRLTVVTSNINLKGTSGKLARADHGHHVAVAAPSGSLSPTSSNTEGSATTLVRSDHNHALTNVCANDDERLVKAVATDLALMTGKNAPAATTHTHNQYSETGHKHNYEDILGLSSTPSFHIKSMDAIVLEQEINQAGKDIWTWYSDSLLVKNIIEGDIIELQGMLRSTSPATTVGVALTPTHQLPHSPEVMIRLFTSAHGGQSAGVSIKYKISAEDLLMAISDHMRVWIGFHTTSANPIHTRTIGSYSERERYTALSYTLYGPYISA